MGLFGNETGYLEGLVELPVALPRTEQRNGNEGIDGVRLDAGIVEGLGGPCGEGVAEAELAQVFEAMDEIADDALAALPGNGAGKVELASGAITASEGAGNCAAEGLGADLAKWGLDTDGAGGARFA